MAVALAHLRHDVAGVAEVLQNLSPQLCCRWWNDLIGTFCGDEERHVSIHRCQFVVEESSHEEGLAFGLCFLLGVEIHFLEGFEQGIGTVDALIALLPEVTGHIHVVVEDKVHGLHQFVVGTAATILVVAGQHCVIMPCLLWIGIHSIQVLIDTGQSLSGILSIDREVGCVLRSHTHRVQITGSQRACEKCCA